MTQDLTLIFHLSLYEFSYLIINTKKNYITKTQTYQLADSSIETITNQIEDIVKNDTQLHAIFHKTLGTIDIGNTTLIPDSLFDQNYKHEYFNLTNTYLKDEVMYERLKFSPCFALFTLNNKIYKKLSSLFKKAIIKNTGSVLIDYSLYLSKKNEKELFLHIDKSIFHIIITDDKKLIFYNKYNFKTTNDFIYYLINCINVLGIDSEDIKIKIMTNKDISDPIFGKTKKYINKLIFLAKDVKFTYDHSIKNQADHMHHNLLSQIICE